MLIILSTITFGVIVIAAYWYRNRHDYHHNGNPLFK